MEVAIRWSPHSTEQNPRFMTVSVANNRLRLCQIQSVGRNGAIHSKQLAVRDKLPNFTAFDWSKTDERFVAVGSASGEAVLLQLEPDRESDFMHAFPIKHQRKCNSIAFSIKNYLATGLDRVRNDFCMNIYDVNTSSLSLQQEPVKKIASSEAVSSIKFFASQPDTLVAGVSRQYIRLYDLRDSAGVSVAQYQTRQVHNVAIDPLDENYFISAGPAGDPTVSVWDKRFAARSNPGTPSEGSHSGPVLELRPAVDNSQSATIWSLRFSGMKRGSFGVLSSTGEVRMVELAQHSVKSALDPNPVNHLGGHAWNSAHYTKVTHNVEYPYYDHTYGRGEDNRVIAYDFMSAGSPVEGQCAIALHQDRQIDRLRIPQRPPQLNFTALDELYRGQKPLSRPKSRDGTVAEYVIGLRRKVSDQRALKEEDDRETSTVSERPSATDDSFTRENTKTSLQLHEDLMSLGFPEVKLSLEDTLGLLQVQKRRCQEGYLLDCHKNKSVVADDPWLVDMWDLILRMDELREGDGMVAQSVDFSYLGIWSIWSNRVLRHPTDRRLLSDEPATEATLFNAINDILRNKDYTAFQGVKTRWPGHRQLCLAVCGWDLPKARLREQSMNLIEQGSYYKAIVLATLKGQKDLSLELLKYCVKQKYVQNIGLAAIIAGSSVNEEQREMCTWMADETDDPYLKALLAYFVSGDWTTVAEMDQLTLSDRTGVALKYLDDGSLTQFLKSSLSHALDRGDIEGIVLTGLDTQAIELFERYIDKSGDIQTPVLALARVHPLYIEDERWALWHETYLFMMQSWRAFHERARFVSQHNERSINRQNRCMNKPPPQQLTIRCNNCQLSLARRPKAGYVPGFEPSSQQQDGNHIKMKRNVLAPKTSNGQVCPQCGAPMPRCGICMMWLGSPDPAKAGGAAAIAGEDPSARQMVLCLACGHGFHGNHAKDWFARHQMCPVPDCQCMCGLLR